MGDGRAVQVLSREECELLIAGADIGRVILTAQALPTALPVSYAVDGGDIVFCTSAGAKLAAADKGTVVAFEVDHFDPALRIGWSVVVTGLATVVTDPREIGRLEGLGIETWVDLSPTHYVRLSASMVSGRRVAPRPVVPASACS
jgi:nitroimidazol reductase NimA-like FMN-containing flavoprotein (pyridoxamine 5'-phosphate oxidase superfamily)